MTNKTLIQIASFIIFGLIFNLIPWIGLGIWAVFIVVLGTINNLPTTQINKTTYEIQDFLDHKNEFRKYLKFSFQHDVEIYIFAIGLGLMIIVWATRDLVSFNSVLIDTRLTTACYGAIFGAYFFRSYIQAYKEMK